MVEVDPTIRLRAEGFIPESYVPDPAVRLNLYKRLAALREEQQLIDFADEMADRFGPVPSEMQWLFWVMDLKRQARALRIQEIDARRDAIRVRFGPEPPISPETIITLLRTERGRLRYLPEDALEYRTDGTTPEACLAAARKILQRLTAGVTVAG